MSQHDLVIDNASGASVRTDINNGLQALGSRQSGASAPATTYAHMLWVDTTNGVVKRRNAANSGWIVVETNDESFVLARSSNTILGLSDKGKTVVATSTFTQTLTAAATLGDGWYCDLRNDGTGIITLDPNSTEQVNGATTLKVYPGEACRIVCDGSGFKALFQGNAAVTIQTQTASGATSVDFTTGIDSSFERYELELSSVLPATDATDLWLRVSEDAGATWKSGGTDYGYANTVATDGALTVAQGSTGAAQMVVAATCGNAATKGTNIVISFNAPSSTSAHKYFSGIGSYFSTALGGIAFSGRYKGTANAITGVRALMSSGNINGKFTLRGYRRG